MFANLEEVISALVTATQLESSAKWATGDILVEGVARDALRAYGLTKREFLAAVGVAIGRGKRTVEKRLKTSLTFPASERLEAVSWEAHHLCATTDTPLYWLKVAADQQLSVDQLEAAIKAAGGEPRKEDPEYLYRAHSAAFVPGDPGSGVMGVLYEVDAAPVGAHAVTITMLEYPQDAPAQVDAPEGKVFADWKQTVNRLARAS